MITFGFSPYAKVCDGFFLDIERPGSYFPDCSFRLPAVSNIYPVPTGAGRKH
jgi:hypothetical protein